MSWNSAQVLSELEECSEFISPPMGMCARSHFGSIAALSLVLFAMSQAAGRVLSAAALAEGSSSSSSGSHGLDLADRCLNIADALAGSASSSSASGAVNVADRCLHIASAVGGSASASSDSLVVDVADRLLNIAEAMQDTPQPCSAPNAQNRWGKRWRVAVQQEARRVRSAPVKALHAEAMQTHTVVHNIEIASLEDAQRDVGNVARAWKHVGAGRWKQRTPEEACRVVFHSPSTPMIEVAKSLRPQASSRHCTDLLFAGCEKLKCMQNDAVDDWIGGPSGNSGLGLGFVVFQWSYDETKYRMFQRGDFKNSAEEVSLLAVHGQYIYKI